VAAAASTGSAGVDPNEPMPNVMSTNRGQAEPIQAEPTQPTAQTAEPTQPTAQTAEPTQAEPTQQTATPPQSATAPPPSPAVSQTALPDISKLTPEQKKQLLAQIDKQLAKTNAPSAPVPTVATQQATATPAPTQQPTADKMQPEPAQQATATPAPTQQPTADKMPASVETPIAKTPKPKVPYSAVQTAQSAKVAAPRNPGAPTDAEYNKFQNLLKQAMAKQGQNA
jgi:hypothetical protein